MQTCRSTFSAVDALKTSDAVTLVLVEEILTLELGAWARR